MFRHESRVLILGSNISGAPSARDVLRSALAERGMTSTKVEFIRYLNHVKSNIRQAGPPKLRCVMLFPEMREKIGWLPRFVHVYEEGVDVRIRQLCRQQNVPLLEMKNWESYEAVKLLAGLLE